MKATFVKSGSNIEILTLDENELFSLLKINVECLFVFKKGDNIQYSIKLKDRIEIDGHNMIVIESDDFSGELDYDDLIALIAEKTKTLMLSVLIDKKIFIEKEALLMLIDTLNQEIIHACVHIDYNKTKSLFKLFNKVHSNGVRDILYYFDENDSVLAFTDEGPKLIYGKTSSVEDVLCQ